MWANIGVFLAVYDHGSTLSASRELGMSQATVARRIDALEHALGLGLFTRDTRGAHPTDAAHEIAASGRSIGEAVGAFMARAEYLGHEMRQNIRISAPSPNFSKAFSDILADYVKQFPDTRFSLLPSDQPVNVGAGDSDMAMLYTRRISDNTLICRRLGVERTTLYASPEYLALNGRPRSPDDLRGQNIINVSGKKLPQHIADWIDERTTPEMITSRCENIASLVAAIQMGKGLGPLPLTLGDMVEGVERCFEAPAALDLPVWLVINPDAYRRPSVVRFTKFLAPRLAALIGDRGTEK